jgi:hypothetical protein
MTEDFFPVHIYPIFRLLPENRQAIPIRNKPFDGLRDGQILWFGREALAPLTNRNYFRRIVYILNTMNL